MSRTMHHAARRIASVRPKRIAFVTCRPSVPFSLTDAPPARVDDGAVRFYGGTPDLDALVVHLAIRQSVRVQIGQLVSALGFDLPRLMGAIDLLVQDRRLLAESHPLTEQTWVRRS